MQRQPGADQLADQPHAFDRHQNIEGLHRPRSFISTFAPRPDVAHGPPMTSLDGAPQARRRPRVRRIMLSDFRSYAELDLAIEGRLVVLCGENGAGKTNLLEAVSLFAPGRGLRRAELSECARVGGGGGFAFSVEIEEDRETHQLGSGWKRGPDGDEAERLNRIDRAAVASSRAFCDHVRIVWLTPAMDSLFAGPAAERRRFLDRFVLAIDPNHGARVGQFERALRGRNRLLDEGGRNAAWLDAIEREAAELAVAVAAARLECVRRLEALIDADRDDASPFPWAKLALEGEVEALVERDPALAAEDRYRAILRDNRGRDAAAGRTLIGPHLGDLMVWHGPKGAPAAQSSTGEQKALLVGLVLAHARLVARDVGASRRSRCSTRSRPISIRAAAPRCSTRSSGSAARCSSPAPTPPLSANSSAGRRCSRFRPSPACGPHPALQVALSHEHGDQDGSLFRLRRSARAGTRLQAWPALGREHPLVHAQNRERAIIFSGEIGVEDETGIGGTGEPAIGEESRFRADPRPSRHSRAPAPRAPGRSPWRSRAGCRASR